MFGAHVLTKADLKKIADKKAKALLGVETFEEAMLKVKKGDLKGTATEAMFKHLACLLKAKDLG